MVPAKIVQYCQLIVTNIPPPLLLIAAEFLSTCGSLVHFSDHLQGLTNLYFLDPVWLYNILSQVANIKSSLVSEGRIHKKSLAELYEASGFGKEQFEEYLQLLQRLEILLPISRFQ